MNLGPEIFRKRLIIEGKYTSFIENEAFVNDFLINLSKEMEMTIINGPHISSATGKAIPLHDGYEGSLVWAESGANTYIWTKFNFCTVDIYSCKNFDTNKAIEFVKKSLGITDFSYFELPDPLALKQDYRIEIKNTEKGSGVFAKDFIPVNTELSYIDGQIYFAENESDFEKRKDEPLYYAREHAVPFHKKFYRNAFNSLAVKYNHSCEPNCYAKDLFFVTTMRDIQAGEELTMSYSLFCNSDWQVPGGKCLCGSQNCLGDILPWRNLPSDYKTKYLDYTADWIVLSEMKDRGLFKIFKENL
jgi:S-adenosylmethionine decarboxylase